MFKNFKETVGWFFTALFIMGLVFFLAVQTGLLIQLLSGTNSGFPSLEDGNIAVLPLQGGIYEVRESLDKIDQFKDDPSIKGLLLQIDSPGGLVGPSQELSKAVSRFSEEKPVVASVRTVGASGAYYVASSADTIVVNPGSMVGSIGVLMEFVNVKDLTKKIGLEYNVIKSGDYKDLGSPFRDMTEEERGIIRNVIMDVYDQFLDHILENRDSLTRARLEKMADGRIFTGNQAKKKGLIDQTGGQHKAVQILSEAANIEGEPKLVEPSRNELSFSEMQSYFIETFLPIIEAPDRPFRLLYMMKSWEGGISG